MRVTLALAGLCAVACAPASSPMDDRLADYATVRLTADLSGLTDAERAMLPLLIQAAEAMDSVFWLQAFGDRDSLLRSLDDPAMRRFAELNYGPWDRLNGNAPFVPGGGAKPAGANLYPPDATREELEAWVAAHPERADGVRSLYTVVRRAEDGFAAAPYHEVFAGHFQRAATRLREAAALAEDGDLRTYLILRADALESGEYRASDLAWMDMTTNRLDVVIGPIETYEDALMGWKASAEAFVLIKDRAWSERLARYAALLPGLQAGLPVPPAYRRDAVGTDSELNAYDVVYYAGEANAGSKTIAINLPNDEVVQQEKGTRRLQLRNAMRAKFDSILVPLAAALIAPDQRVHVTFDAFFANVMFHEVAHGLGIRNTITGRGTVREALREHASPFEEGKADVLGLYMVTSLHAAGELGDAPLEDYYVTFLASIFRSVRFGAASAHGRANMVRFNFFRDEGAFVRRDDGTYAVDMDRMRAAMTALSRLLLTIQGDGDHEAAGRLLRERGLIGPELQADLDRLAALGIPVDIVFEQGPAVLGLR